MTKPGLIRPIVIPRKRDLKELIVLNTAKLLGLSRKEILERLDKKSAARAHALGPESLSPQANAAA